MNVYDGYGIKQLFNSHYFKAVNAVLFYLVIQLIWQAEKLQEAYGKTTILDLINSI